MGLVADGGPLAAVKADPGKAASADFEFASHAEGMPAADDESSSTKARSAALLRGGSGLFSFLAGRDIQWAIYLTIVSVVVRLAFLSHPAVVIFDEVHFGGFAKHYLAGNFFNDLHPPLAKLLVYLSALVGGGIDQKFTFYDIGADYSNAAVPYVMMRLFPAICGAAVPPIAFFTMRAIGVTRQTSIAVAAALIFENALVTQSRLILLDSYLVLATALVALSWALFDRQRQAPFSRSWHVSLVSLGASLALAASAKWVGLFAVMAVGVYTIADLWTILGDTRVPLRAVSKHFVARVIALILLPATIYMAIFWVHFSILTNYTPDAASLSLEYQQGLHGGSLPPTLEPVFFGSTVRIRQYKSDGAFLHSHNHVYPEGSKQQQVNGYSHRDLNNLWVFRRPFDEGGSDGKPNELLELVPLYHRSTLRLMHFPTRRYLHSHHIEPPLSNKEKQNEVSAYGHHEEGASDANDNWRIEIVDGEGNSITAEEELYDEISGRARAARASSKKNKSKKKGEESPPAPEETVALTPDNVFPILAIGTKFRLRHISAHCYLHSRNKKLPDWGFGQFEVTCGTETLRRNQIWIVESNEHPKASERSDLPTVSVQPKSFWGKFLEINKRMWDSNAGLPSEHPYGSRPQSWPFLGRGLGFWNGSHVGKTLRQYLDEKKAKKDDDGSDNEAESVALSGLALDEEEERIEQARMEAVYRQFKGTQVHLIGNPIVWWGSTAGLASFILLLAAYRISKRGGLAVARVLERSSFSRQLVLGSPASFLVVSWMWHYVPFFGMNRQLFLHHYLPALYFAVLLMAIMMDALLSAATSLPRLSRAAGDRIRLALLAAFVLTTVVVFFKFAPLAYATKMTKSQCMRLKWLPRWDFDCDSLTDPIHAAVTAGKGGAS